MKYSILSERGYMHWASWDVVYEWEDAISEYTGCRLITFREGLRGKFIRRGIREINKVGRKNLQYRITNRNKVKLLFVMNASIYRDLPTRNIIPIFLDFPVSMVDTIVNATKRLPVFFVTCVDIYNFLEKKSVKNVRYMPLSIADKYCVETIPEKTIDVIQFGRKNKVLHEYMLKYCDEHPSTEYVYQTADGSLTYYSTTRGNIGKFDSRDEYLDLIKKCKVSLVSSPGCDKGRTREFGNIDFITPRFYESAALYCYLIGRYTENEETERLGLKRVCPCIEEYSQFEKMIRSYVSTSKYDWSMQQQFIEDNKTSKRAEFIQNEIEAL